MNKRTIVDLPEEDLRLLDALAKANASPRAAIVREAVAEYVTRKSNVPSATKPLAGFGSLKGYYGDGLSWQNQLREEWE